ncbi:hypothetical protein FRC01_002969 [Tulasnella sp. 417]|nr:hypothetical protein FRC01_002969 [Tulasnella sp. 417]
MLQRSKLQKLAEWRIDPSLIKFPEDAREFRGGFATVSQGLLASPSSAKRGANKSKHVADQYSSSETSNPQPCSVAQNPEGDHQGKEEGADSRTADGDDGHAKGEGIKDNDEEQKANNQTLIPKIEHDLPSPEHTVNEDQDSGNRDTQSPHDIQKPGDGLQNKDEGRDSRITDGDNGQTKEEVRTNPENANEEQSRDRPISKPKVRDEPSS